MAEPEKLNEQTRTPSEGQVTVTVYRSLTFLKGNDWDKVEGIITYPITAAPEQINRAYQMFTESMVEMDKRLQKEKQDALQRAGITATAQPTTRPPTIPVSTPAPSQQAPAGDPYFGLDWREGRTKIGKTYGYRMVKPDQPALATQLHNALKAAPGNRLTFGTIEYRLTVAKVDRLPAYRAGTEFLQRWEN